MQQFWTIFYRNTHTYEKSTIEIDGWKGIYPRYLLWHIFIFHLEKFTGTKFFFTEMLTSLDYLNKSKLFYYFIMSFNLVNSCVPILIRWLWTESKLTLSLAANLIYNWSFIRSRKILAFDFLKQKWAAKKFMLRLY